MTDKRDVKRRLYRLEQIKLWQLVVLLILMAFVSATFLRLNNIGMIERYEAVMAADKAGDNHITQNRLVDLQAYTIRHMNASTGDIYLVEKYNRDVEQAALARSQASGNSGSTREADEYCRQLIGGYSQNYVQCVYDRIDQLPAVQDPAADIPMPNASLYKHNFVSPLWTPDFAGWSVLLTALLAVLITVRLIVAGVLSILLKIRYRGA